LGFPIDRRFRWFSLIAVATVLAIIVATVLAVIVAMMATTTLSRLEPKTALVSPTVELTL
jgi:hypothetical protein